MLNPWILLAIGVVWAASLGASYVSGSRHATNAAKAAQADATARLIKEHQENTVIDMAAAVADAESRQKTKIEYRDRVQTVEKVLREKPQNPDCALPDDAVGLLNDAIRAANHSPAASERPIVPAPAPAK